MCVLTRRQSIRDWTLIILLSSAAQHSRCVYVLLCLPTDVTLLNGEYDA